jgi:Holliday junction DNA helicase RuvB|tara:strand:- start:329 stop:1255 length:927 start_codon:yes stop_codon:yes gene_type:complete
MSNILRPTRLDDLIGQNEIIDNLKISIASVKSRSAVLQHCLFYGGAGLGKTTLARALANELNVSIEIANGAAISQNKDIIPYLMKMQRGSILFIDEIHRMNTKVQEYMLTVIEDFRLDIVVPSTKTTQGETITMELPKFTLLGATTEMGELVQPFLDRFKLKHYMRPYEPSELAELIVGNAKKLNVCISQDGMETIANASRGTPRISNSLLEWVRDYGIAKGISSLNKSEVTEALIMQGIDEKGMTPMDRNYLKALKKLSDGSAVGVNTLCSCLNIDRKTLEQKIEPFLIRNGYIRKTPKGRVLIKGI